MGVAMRYQPQGLAALSTSNPLIKGLALAINPGAGVFDQATRRAGVLNGTFRRHSAAGVGIQAVSSSSIGASFAASPMRTSDGAGVGDFTYVVVASPILSSQREIFVSCGNGSSEFYLLANATVSNVASPGMFAAQTNSGGASGLQVAGAVDGNPHVFAYSRRVNGGACDAAMYRDGVLLASGTVNKVQMWSSASLDYVGGVSVTGYGSSSPVALVLGWNRALSAAEVADVSRNPWQVFEAMDDWDDVLAGAISALVAEIAAAADASGCVLYAAAATAEASAVADAPGASTLYAGAAHEAASVDFASAATAALIAAAVESGTVVAAGDWSAGNSTAGVVEAATPVDADGAVLAMLAECIVTVTAGDSVSNLLQAVASATESAGAVDVSSAIRAGEVAFARAPTGSGYQPQRAEAQARQQSGPQMRPAAIQRTIR